MTFPIFLADSLLTESERRILHEELEKELSRKKLKKYAIRSIILLVVILWISATIYLVQLSPKMTYYVLAFYIPFFIVLIMNLPMIFMASSRRRY